MKKRTYFCLFVLCIGLFAGCKAKKMAVASYSDLDGEWEVTELNGKELDPAATNQLLVFDTSRNHLSGHAGCNRIMGQIEHNLAYRNIVKFPHVGSTRMLCPDMSGETALLEALRQIVRIESMSRAKPIDEVALFGMDNSRMIVIKKKGKARTE